MAKVCASAVSAFAGFSPAASDALLMRSVAARSAAHTAHRAVAKELMATWRVRWRMPGKVKATGRGGR